MIGGLEYAKALGAKTIAIACNAGSAIGEIADVSIWVDVGPEIIAGSTRMKAGTAQKLILNMLSTAVMIRLGKVYGNLMVDVKVSNQKLAERARRLVMRLTGADDEGARELLARANNEVKAAVVMSRLAVDFAEARRLLAKTDGKLRDCHRRSQRLSAPLLAFPVDWVGLIDHRLYCIAKIISAEKLRLRPGFDL